MVTEGKVSAKMNQRVKLYIIMVLSILILSWETQQMLPVEAGDQHFIPEESIRLRILANSNAPLDQTVKRNIRDAVNTQITTWVEHLQDVDDAREIIGANMADLNEIVAGELEAAGSNEPFSVELRETAFPTKLYGSRLYPAGDYEAVVVTLGDGKGDNWWCVLFPPLCFLDFSNSDAKAHEAEGENTTGEDNAEEVQVSFFIVDVFTNLWDKITS